MPTFAQVNENIFATLKVDGFVPLHPGSPTPTTARTAVVSFESATVSRMMGGKYQISATLNIMLYDQQRRAGGTEYALADTFFTMTPPNSVDTWIFQSISYVTLDSSQRAAVATFLVEWMQD